jgi:hypothetical protein
MKHRKFIVTTITRAAARKLEDIWDVIESANPGEYNLGEVLSAAIITCHKSLSEPADEAKIGFKTE